MRMFKLCFIACGCWALLAGCSQTDGRSPEELLSLSVSGLSGVDRYAFSGTTVIASGNAASGRSVAFQGTVTGHDQVALQGSEGKDAGSAVKPLEYLSRIEDTAVRTELLEAESDEEKVMLRITADPDKSASVWADNLRADFAMLEKQVPGSASGATAASNGERAGDPKKQEELRREWAAELKRSKQALDAMLATAKVTSTYKLAIDRQSLLPRSLEENTLFRYTVDGQNAEEKRITKLTIGKTAKR